MTGQRAKTTPAAMELKARDAGKSHTAIAMISPTISPANDACHAGRRRTPSSTRTAATGSAATMNESGRLSATGVSNCLNMLSVSIPDGRLVAMSMLTLDRTQAKRNVMMSGKVYSYTRFSSPAQAKGDSLRRQTKDAADWAAAHGMALDTDLTFHDAGLSAWTGENEGGQLGAFLEAVKHGVVPRGSVLAV